MSKFSSELQEAFGTSNPYEVLQIEQNATEKSLKSAYKRLALKYHPDKAPLAGDGRKSDGKVDDDDDQSTKQKWTKKFQLLSKCHQILSDKDRRAVYDETGELDDESDGGSGDGVRNWDEYWRLLFPSITEEQILAFEQKYKHSDEERDDLIKAYEKHKGDMTKIMEEMPLSVHEDEQRFRDTLEGLIAEKTVEAFKAFTNESSKKRQARKRRAEKEAVEAEALLKEIKAKASSSGGGNSLAEIIGNRQKARAAQAESFFDNLAAKYGGADEAEVDNADDNDEDDNESDDETEKKRGNKRSNGRGVKRGRGRAATSGAGKSDQKKRKAK